ncbi:MAG: hypothetical protein HQK57_05290 [Deltaproteobacteria bacterium]|nr:hypothetical protein [Deltaproteobacteria bacterium]
MEIQTTVKDFPNRVKSLHIHPDASIRVIIDAIQVEPEQKTEEPGELVETKGKWAKVAERFRAEDNLKGISEEVNKLFREFRDNFSFERK